IERAMDDVRHAKFRLRDKPFVRFTSAYCLIDASTMYGEAGQPERQKVALAEAKDDLDALENIPVSAFIHMKAIYLEVVGDDEAALKLLEQTVAREELKELVWYYVMALYRKGQVEKALDALDQSRQPENLTLQLLRIFLLAELPRYGPAKAYE